MNAYAETILSAEAAAPMQYRFAPLDEATRFMLPVWCYRAGAKGVYHDYLVTYYHDAAFESLLDAHPRGFTFAGAAEQGVSQDTVLAWYREGYLVPVTNEGA